MLNCEKDENFLCVVCKTPALANCFSEAGRREVFKTGICEKCFDDLFKEEDEEED